MDTIPENYKEVKSRTHLVPIAQACFVTVLWSSSWIIIKYGLEEIPPLIFAGLRYSIASVILLLAIAAQSEKKKQLRGHTRKWWMNLTVYGIVYITLTQGTQFLALKYLPAITLSLLLNLTPIIVLAIATLSLKESPTPIETLFIFLSLIGVLVYFYPLDLVGVSILGLVVGIVSLLANSIGAIIGRAINRGQDTPALIVTGISMTIGSFFLLLFGVLTESVTSLSLLSWASILWLAIMNTAIAFTLWNGAMRELRAIDTTLINSTMMPQIVLLSIVFLAEYPTFTDWVGLVLLAIGIAAVQVLQVRRKERLA